jgi:hypothetical protein
MKTYKFLNIIVFFLLESEKDFVGLLHLAYPKLQKSLNL